MSQQSTDVSPQPSPPETAHTAAANPETIQTTSEGTKTPLTPELLETKILQMIDPNVNKPDAAVPMPASTAGISPQALKRGHPRRKGLLIFCPHRLVETVWQISADELLQVGVAGVILDLDNTLVKWQQDEMTEEVTGWLKALQERKIKLCILSNSMMSKRSETIANKLNSPYVRHARKPSRVGFEKAMAAMGTVPANTAIVGDQMFTDIWGGNRTGIYTIMVKPIHPREFAYTRYVSRPPEKLLLKYFKRGGHLKG